MRRMISGDYLNVVFQQRLPEFAIVVGRFHRGICLDPSAQPRVVVDGEKQMVWTSLGRDESLVINK